MNDRATTASTMATAFRTHTCGELGPDHVGKEVRLCGAVSRVLDDDHIELRDAFGSTVVTVTPDCHTLLQRQIEAPLPTLETIIQVTGQVVALDPAPAGAQPVGVVADGLDILSIARSPLLFDHRDPDVSRWDRIRYRYLWLRNPTAHKLFAFRTTFSHGLRRYLHDRDFREVETPILSARWSPEAADSFIAIRGMEQIFSLPGARPVHGPIQMASGFDKVYEFARRFSRKDQYGPMEQPEYTLLDVNMAWVKLPDLVSLCDELIGYISTGILELADPIPLTELSYDEAWRRFGSETPDLRYDLELVDLDAVGASSRSPRVRMTIEAGGALRGLRLRRGATRERQIGFLDDLVTDPVGTSLHWFTLGEGGRLDMKGTWGYDERLARDIGNAMGAQFGDLVVLAAGETRRAAEDLAGRTRRHIGERLSLHEREHALVRVTNPPYYHEDLVTGDLHLRGDLLTRPVNDDLDTPGAEMRAQAFTLVLDGVDVGEASVRNHDLKHLRQLFRHFGLDGMAVDQRFGHLLDVLKHGYPPNGRLSLGIDRWVALLSGLDSIDDVIPMPKIFDGSDPLVRSPWPMNRALLRGYLGV